MCHGVMYKQLAAWMLHGLLLDQNEEFFVKQGPSAGGAAANQEEEEEDLGLGGLSGKQLRELQDLVRTPPPVPLRRELATPSLTGAAVWWQRLIEEENMLAPSLQQFSLRAEMLPSYIPVRVAEKILFVGESVQMFENHAHGPSRAGKTPGRPPGDLLPARRRGLRRFVRKRPFSRFFSQSGVRVSGGADGGLLCPGSILKHQEDAFATELHKLKQEPLFSLVDFEDLIDRIRSAVAEVSSRRRRPRTGERARVLRTFPSP